MSTLPPDPVAVMDAAAREVFATNPGGKVQPARLEEIRRKVPQAASASGEAA